MKRIVIRKEMFFVIFMVAIYVGMGSLLAFSGMFDIPRAMGIIIGILMMLYGVFRAVRLFPKQ